MGEFAGKGEMEEKVVEGLLMVVRGGECGLEREVELEERKMTGGSPKACRRWRGWRCGGPEAAAA